MIAEPISQLTTADFWSKENVLTLTPGQIRAALTVGIEDEVKRLKKLDDRKRVLELVFFVALWCVGATLTFWGLALTGVAQVALLGIGLLASGIALNASGLFLHEGMHGVLFKNRRLNRWYSILIGGTVLMSFSAYRVLHQRHHVFLGRKEDIDDYSNHTNNKTILFLMHYMRLTVGSLLYLFAIPYFGYKQGTRWEKKYILQEYALLLPVYALLAIFIPFKLLFFAWFAPLLLAGWMTNIRGFTSHSMVDSSDPLLASRSLRVHPVVAFLLINEHLHHDHHLFPDVPSYNLGKLNKLIWPRLPRALTGDSYPSFLAQFVRASWRGDTTPIGLVYPNRSARDSDAR